jgi:hypothetical protein
MESQLKLHPNPKLKLIVQVVRFCNTIITPIGLNRIIVNGYYGISGSSVVIPIHAIISRLTMWSVFFRFYALP